MKQFLRMHNGTYVNLDHVHTAQGKEDLTLYDKDGEVLGRVYPWVIEDLVTPQVIVPSWPGTRAVVLTCDSDDGTVEDEEMDIVAWRVVPCADETRVAMPVLIDELADNQKALLKTPDGSFLDPGNCAWKDLDEAKAAYRTHELAREARRLRAVR